MFRPNYAQDAPPQSIRVGGADYAVNVDFRVWIDILDRARELYASVGTLEEARHNARVLADLQKMAFGGVLAETMVGEDVGADEDGEELLSFDYDINDLVLAIRAQSGVDLSYRRREPYHWWEFLLQVRALCGDHRILRVMETRALKGDSREARLAKRRVRLPHKPTAGERRTLAALRAAAGEKEETYAH